MLVVPGLAVLLAAALAAADDSPARGAGPEAPAPPDTVPADIRAELASIDALHRSILRRPLEDWQLETIRTRYETLKKRVTDATTPELLRDRLAMVARQESMAREARTIAAILARSRRRDRDVALVRHRLSSVARSTAAPYDAEGLIQPSARKVQGEKVLALIGADGYAVAYLKVPPGLDTRPFQMRRVGVRGAVRYDDRLHARVIAVRDMEPLESQP